MTIPRLELCAATVAVKLARLVLQELELKIDRTVFWTDFTSVLQYIMNTSSRFETFVANRLAIILDGSEPTQWKHVDARRNPADIASRGIMPDSCTKAQLWLRGPEFLWQDNSWPLRPGVLPPLPESDPEIKRESKVNAAVSVSQEELYQLLNYYSSWYKLLKAVS